MIRRFLKPLVVDRHSNFEIVRVVTFIGAFACLIVFVEANVHYIIAPGAEGYDLVKVGDLMDKFAYSFAWIIGSGAAGIAARSMTDKTADHNGDGTKPDCEEDKGGRR